MTNCQTNNDEEETILHCEPNLDTENIITPINAKVLKKLLNDANYDKKETAFLVNGFSNGFSIEYRGLRRGNCILRTYHHIVIQKRSIGTK